MTCVAPPELDSAALLRAIDGNASAETQEHLQQCPHCRSRMDELRRLQSGLITSLFRVDCPSPEALSDFAQGRVGQSEAGPVAQHLQACPHCQAELDLMSGWLDQPPAEADRREITIVVGKRQQARGVETPAELALQPTRATPGQETPGPLIFQVDGMQVSLALDLDPDVPGALVIVGLLTAEDLNQWTASLISEEDLIDRVPVDALGNFTFDATAPGEYQLLLSSPLVELLLEPFEVEA